MINTRISGDPTRKWHEHFARATGRTFERALILNCGNGWVERELVGSGLIAEGVGIDYSQTLLDEAAAAASAEAGMPLTYHQANVNTGTFPEGEFDLVVNHAAAHHIAAIDRVFREVCRILPDDGWFVSFDYVGPHRNQYRLDAWEEAWQLNHELPEPLRQDLRLPADAGHAGGRSHGGGALRADRRDLPPLLLGGCSSPRSVVPSPIRS